MNERSIPHVAPSDDALPRPSRLLRRFTGAIALAAMLGTFAVALSALLVGLALTPMIASWAWLARRSVPGTISGEADAVSTDIDARPVEVIVAPAA